MIPELHETFEHKNIFSILGILVLSALTLFLLTATFSLVKNWTSISHGAITPNTISVDGVGEAFAIPDTALFSFSVIEDAATVEEAQKKVTTNTNATLNYLKKNTIEDKNIKTVNYTVYPKYEFQGSACVPGSRICPPARQVQAGFTAEEMIEVRVHDTTKAGALLGGIGSLGVQNISSLQFVVSDPTQVKNEARSKAIANARDQAQILAHQLGVNLVRITNFIENNSNFIRPMVGVAQSDMAVNVNKAMPPTPQVPVGQNKVTSNVTVTYEIQ